MQNVIGIDVSKEKVDVCALFDGKTKKKIVDNSVSGFKLFVIGFPKLTSIILIFA